MSFIGASESFQGEFSFEGDFQIFGKFKGRIQSKSGSLFIKEGASLEGHITVSHLFVSGSFSGSCVCERAEIKDSSLTKADIKCKFIKIDKGAKFIGSFQMDSPSTIPQS